MKNFFYLLFFFCTNFLYAGTGGARDEYFFVGIIMLVLVLILGILYLISFIIKKIKKSKEQAEVAEQTDSSLI